jgi:GAF domain-containing protein
VGAPSDADGFRADYAAGLNAYLRDGDDRALHSASELGRRAVELELSLVELAAAYHEPLLQALYARTDVAAAADVARAASQYYLESLRDPERARQEMVEDVDRARAERRNAALLRQLSTFLADTSLALTTLDAVEEVLTLAVEQAREILGADCAQATVQLGDGLPITAASQADGERAWAGYLSDQLRPPGPESRPQGDWITAPITALDGRQLGSMEVVEKTDGDFTELDQAVLAHIAEMASAAIERAQLYHERR